MAEPEFDPKFPEWLQSPPWLMAPHATCLGGSWHSRGLQMERYDESPLKARGLLVELEEADALPRMFGYG